MEEIMKSCKCLMGVMLSAVLLIGTAFAANTLQKVTDVDVMAGIAMKGGIVQINKAVRNIGPAASENNERGCEDCEFDFTPYGSECCDSAWDEFGIDCVTLEANYNWDCAGCLCPGDGEAVCGDGNCTGDETYETCPSDCNAPGTCDAGQVLDCDGSDECWPESWIGDGFADCQDQAYGADLTCYDCDGGDCPDTDPGCGGTAECGDGSCNGDETEADCPEDCMSSGDCADCEFDFTPYGSECCDTAWDEFGITCSDLEANYSWDCAGCNCPGDVPAVCGDGACTGDETPDNCPEDCDGSCAGGEVADCDGSGECWPESWIGDGFADCNDQAYGADLTCYDCDGGDCPDTDPGCSGSCEDQGMVTCWDGSCAATEADCSAEPEVEDPTGVCIEGADYNGYAAVTVSWDITTECGDGTCNGDEDEASCPEDCNSDCAAGEVADCDGSGECWPESWIGDGFADCQDQAYGADLTCYDCDGGDCPGSDPGCGGTAECGDGYCNGDETAESCPEDCDNGNGGTCDDCEFDFTPYGSECCDTAWDEFGIDCADLEANYSWDCAGCNCPGDVEAECGDGMCNGDETYDTCPADCDPPSGDCADCEFDFTPYGSECCDTAWDEFGIDCATLESNYSWDCAGCNCPGDIPCEDLGMITCEFGAIGGGNCAEDESGCLEEGTCPAGQIVDCDGTGECWPESWIGDGFADCNDQAYGADLTCYDCDGGDCPESDPGCSGESCEDQGMITCFDGSCAASEADCEGCPAGTIADCSGDGDCGFDTWIGDGYCDGSAQQYGIDNCCYDNDGGDCTDEECAGGRAEATSTFKKGNEPATVYMSKDADMIPVEQNEVLAISRDGVVFQKGTTAVRFNEEFSTSVRTHTATVALSCDVCLDGGPWEGAWDVEAEAFGYFTVYGFDAGSTVCGTVTFCEGGACSDTSEEVCAVAGDMDSSDCAEGGCDTAGTGDVNGDGDANVLDIVTIVNVILGGEFADECAAAAADVNGDGEANVLDIVQIVNGILGGGRVDDASSAKLIKSDETVILEANGYIGGIQMTLSHDRDFSIDLTDKALVAEYNTVGNETILVIVAPEGEELFTYSGDFEIVDMIVANSQDRVNVGAPTEFSLSTAYPNPFNPTTSLELSVPMNGQVTVQVYNLMGQVVATLANGYMDASTYTLTWDASDVSSGMYIVKAEAAGTVSTQKLMLMK